MSSSLQIPLFLAALGTCIFVIYCSVKQRMNVRYAVVWILWSLSVLLLSVFPQIIDKLSQLLSIAVPVNTLFLITIFLLYILVFYLYLRFSHVNNQIKDLTYEIANLKKQIQDKK